MSKNICFNILAAAVFTYGVLVTGHLLNDNQDVTKTQPAATKHLYDGDNLVTSRENMRLHPQPDTGLTDWVNAQAGIQSDEFMVTAYCPCVKCCGKWADGKTATGANAFSMGVAVDKALIPLGSEVTIPGYGRVLADDVGGGIKKRHIDVRFATHQEALEWGVRTITVEWRE